MPNRISRQESAAGTFGQSIGRLGTLIRQMRPTWQMARLDELHPDFVTRHDIGGLIWDIDGTLTAYHARELHPEVAAAFRALGTVPGLRHAILSNAPEWRWRELALVFPDCPVVRLYRQGDALIPRTLRGTEDSWSAAEREERLAAGAIAVRKPSGPLVLEAARQLEVEPARVVMIGDQYLTDVAGANLAGVRSIRLPTLARESFPRSIRLSQWLERMIFALRHGGRGVGEAA